MLSHRTAQQVLRAFTDNQRWSLQQMAFVISHLVNTSFRAPKRVVHPHDVLPEAFGKRPGPDPEWLGEMHERHQGRIEREKEKKKQTSDQ